ncbi:hypothetical protein WG907_06950 [Sphingobium sp. AN558]|uniref:hypothetical protein n=1 Tax=Sphingobium sp. AN558 TaxID=3133442 RepID=UPI0030C5DA9B
MAGFSFNTVAMLIVSVAAQILAISLMPMTRGLSHPLFTLAMAVAILIGVGLMARIAHAGVDLSALAPIIAATVPLGAIAVGIFAYGESASLAKLATLVTACILVGVANIL